MCYMIAETGDCPFCKAIMHHTQTRHAPTLPRDEITRADPRRATHTIADPLTGDESDDALLRMPASKRAPPPSTPSRSATCSTCSSAHNTTCPKPRASRASNRNYLYRMMKKHGIARKE